MSKKKPRKLMDLVRDKIRIKRYSHSTEVTYCHWILRFIRLHGKKGGLGTYK